MPCLRRHSRSAAHLWARQQPSMTSDMIKTYKKVKIIKRADTNTALQTNGTTTTALLTIARWSAVATLKRPLDSVVAKSYTLRCKHGGQTWPLPNSGDTPLKDNHHIMLSLASPLMRRPLRQRWPPPWWLAMVRQPLLWRSPSDIVSFCIHSRLRYFLLLFLGYLFFYSSRLYTVMYQTI